MRSVLATFLLIAAPAAASANPLDADRSFADRGVFALVGPTASNALVPLSDGSTLHATDGAGIMRLSARGRLEAAAPLAPAGVPQDLVRSAGGAMVVGQPGVEYGTPTPLGVWRVDRAGRTLEHHAIPMPGGETAHPLRIVRRPPGYVALVRSSSGDPHGTRLAIVFLTAGGALDTRWADGGFRFLGDAATGIGVAPRDGSLVVAQALRTRCQRRGYDERKERARLRVMRLAPDGRTRWSRTQGVGSRIACPLSAVGDVLVEPSGRTTIGGEFGRSAMLLTLRGDGTRHRRFGVRGVVSVADGSWTAVQVARRRGGYAFAYTQDEHGRPFAVAGLVDRRGRGLRRRRLKVTRGRPTSAVFDIAVDARGGLVAAGERHDTNLYIREDYGQPHLAVWRLRRR